MKRPLHLPIPDSKRSNRKAKRNHLTWSLLLFMASRTHVKSQPITPYTQWLTQNPYERPFPISIRITWHEVEWNQVPDDDPTVWIPDAFNESHHQCATWSLQPCSPCQSCYRSDLELVTQLWLHSMFPTTPSYHPSTDVITDSGGEAVTMETGGDADTHVHHHPITVEEGLQPTAPWPDAIEMFPTTPMQPEGVHAMMAESSDDIYFGDDDNVVGIDNRCSSCMSSFKSDFVGQLIDAPLNIKGFAGTETWETKRGTIRWKLLDDKGNPHEFLIPNSYYVPKLGHRLLSPQHWSRETAVDSDQDAPYCVTYHNSAQMVWEGGSATKTVPVDSQNVFTFRLQDSYEEVHAEMAAHGYDPSHDAKPKTCTACEGVEVDVDPEEFTIGEMPGDTPSKAPNPNIFELPYHESGIQPQRMEDPSAELLRYHLKYGHISFKRLQAMAKAGIIPKRLANCPMPMCAACSYGSAIKRPKQTKTKKSIHPPREAKQPGDCTSVDILVSSTPGFIAQMAGALTRKRYKYVCVFVDHKSDLSYVHLLCGQTGEEVLQAKEAYEAYARTQGIAVKHYHADNGIFASKAWRESCIERGQGLTFAGVNSHHQNGRAER